MALLSDMFELVSAWTLSLSLIAHSDHALCESGGPVGLKDLSTGENLLSVDMVWDGSIQSGNFLQKSPTSKLDQCHIGLVAAQLFLDAILVPAQLRGQRLGRWTGGRQVCISIPYLPLPTPEQV